MAEDGAISRSLPVSLRSHRWRGLALVMQAVPPAARTRRTDAARALRPAASMLRVSEVDGNAQPRFDKFRYLVE